MFNQMDTGIGPTDYVEDDRHDLGAAEHYRQFGFSHYIIQAVRGLAEGMAGPYDKHRSGVYHLFHFYLHVLMQELKHTSTFPS